MHILELVSLFLAGLLAGAEFLVCYGVQPALSALGDRAHLEARQSLVRSLRVLVPAVMLPAVVTGVIVAVTDQGAPGVWLRWAGVAAFAAFLATAFAGTVPINIRVDAWDLTNPPNTWKSDVRLWARLDILRSSAAIVAFACFLVALVVGA